MEFLKQLLDATELPVLSAFILGLMTAISPCPLATNITAIAFIGKDIESRKRVFLNGLIYTLGRSLTYTAIGVAFFYGASTFKLAGFFQKFGEKTLGPILIIIGVLMLNVIKLNIGGAGKLREKAENRFKTGFWSVLMLGVVFALGFCPYSGVLYFGMLIPMTISSASGLILPFVFAIGTGLPVIIFAWVIAFTVGEIGGVYNKIKLFEIWFRRVVSLLFIGAGIYSLQFLVV